MESNLLTFIEACCFQCVGTEVVCIGTSLLMSVLCCRKTWNRTECELGHWRLFSGCSWVLKELVLPVKQKTASSPLCSLLPLV